MLAYVRLALQVTTSSLKRSGAFLSFLFCLVCATAAWAESRTVAVLDLAPKAGFITSEAEQVTDIIRSRLVNEKRLAIIERARIDQILAEQNFAVSDIADNSEAVIRVGKLIAAEYIVVGNIGKLMGKISLNISVINVATGRVDEAQSLLTTSDRMLDDITALCSSLVMRIFKDSPAKPDPLINDQKSTQKSEEDFRRFEIGIGAGYEESWIIQSGTPYRLSSAVFTAKFSFLFIPWLGAGLSVGTPLSPSWAPPRIAISAGPVLRIDWVGVYAFFGADVGSAASSFLTKLGVDFNLGPMGLFLEGSVFSWDTQPPSFSLLAGLAFYF